MSATDVDRSLVGDENYDHVILPQIQSIVALSNPFGQFVYIEYIGIHVISN